MDLIFLFVMVVLLIALLTQPSTRRCNLCGQTGLESQYRPCEMCKAKEDVEM